VGGVVKCDARPWTLFAMEGMGCGARDDDPPRAEPQHPRQRVIVREEGQHGSDM
jgi:hypothetical protein